MEPHNQRPAFYRAELWVSSPVHWSPTGKWADVEINGEWVRVAVFPRLHQRFTQRRETRGIDVEESETLSCKLWIRTGRRAKVRTKACVLRSAVTSQVESHFLVQGEVTGISAEEGLAHITVRPNANGKLLEAFTVTVLASNELLDRLSIGQGVQVKGHLRVDRRLVADSAEPIRLQPSRHQPPGLLLPQIGETP